MKNMESFDHIAYWNMVALFISTFWFYFAKLALFLIHFVGRHVFRIKMEELSVPLEPVQESGEPEGREFNGFGEDEEDEPSSFSFKLEYHIPEANTISNEEGSFQAKAISVSNYRFLSEKNFSGFVEEPEAVTLRVHESFIGKGEEKLEFGFLSAGEDEGVMFSNDQKLKTRSTIVSYTSSSFDSDSAGDCEKHIIQSEEKKLLNDQKLEMRSPIVSDTSSSFDSDSAGECEKHSIQSEEKMLLNDQKLEMRRLIVSDTSSSFDSDSSGDSEKHSIQSEDKMLLNDQKLEMRSPIVSDTNSSFDSDSAGDCEKPSIQSEDKMFLQDQKSEARSPIASGINSLSQSEVICNDAGDFQMHVMQSNDEMFLKDRDLSGRSPFSFDTSSDSDSDSMSLSDGYSVKDLVVDSDSDGFLSERDFGDKHSFIDSSTFEVELVEDMATIEEGQLDEAWSDDDSLEAELEMKELNDIEIDKLPSSSKVQIEFMDFSDDEPVDEGCANNTTEEKSEETRFKDLDDEEMDELESLWEHQDLIEQLKMELKRVRAVGLPTIFEESESPKTIEDLKPWRIDEAFLREDPMDELHKFYKSYRERMRKFDILNYQKMYAIGFLQLKDPLESMGAQKPLIPTILSLFSQNLKPLFRHKSSTDPSEKFMKELQVDLETVYVGQTCLSWEFLRWQFEKARELPDSDPYRSHQYSQVAGEFQQFQVLLQRFIENESFQGPRLPSYVKNRCVLQNLLQVPIIKEDCLKEKVDGKKKCNFAITSEMLEDIMEESIRIFWEFVKADKDETSIVLKGLIGNQVDLQDPSDSELMSEIQASLQKKDKKLKDILKTGNCLVKKFKKPREGRSNHDLFFSQVDMKLVSRVLKMSRITTDQLVWCYAKLSKITFSDRKIHREPSFLLFPC